MSTPSGLHVGWVGADTLLIALAYAASVSWVRKSRIRSTVGTHVVAQPLPVATGWSAPLRRGGAGRSALRRFLFAAGLVLVTGPAVALSAEGIAETSGLGQTFVGVAMLAVATSLPELVASIAAVRLGAFDLAVGNLFGSNAMNMAMLVVVDIAYVDAPLLTAVAGGPSLVAGVGAILLMALAVVALVHGRELRLRRLEPDAVVLLLAYAGALAAVAASVRS